MRRKWGAVVIIAAMGAGAATASADQVVVIERLAGGEALVTYNVPGLSGRHAIHEPAGHDLSGPQWSPDGNRIVFGEAGQVMLYDAATGRVSALADGVSATWRPDGTAVTFVRGDRIVTRALTGEETVVPGVDATGVSELAWDPEGEVLTLARPPRIDIAVVESRSVFPLVEDAAGGGAFTAAGNYVFPRTVGGVTTLWTLADSDDAEPVRLTDGPADTQPDVAADGRVLFTREGQGLGLLQGTSLTTFGGGQTEPDWQPCKPTTTACVSATPAAPLKCTARRGTVFVTSGIPTRLGVVCVRNGERLEIVQPPKHGTATVAADGRGLLYTSTAGYLGEDELLVRAISTAGRVSEPQRLIITVREPRSAGTGPTAKLALTGSRRLKLDRRGRVTVRGTCDKDCIVALRVRVKLTSGRIVEGRTVKAAASAGGEVTLRLKRGTVPARRKVAWARVSGEVVGADGRRRTVQLKLR